MNPIDLIRADIAKNGLGLEQEFEPEIYKHVKVVPEEKIDAALLEIEKSGNQIYAAGMLKTLQILGLEE
jgi:hypothetical protein